MGSPSASSPSGSVRPPGALAARTEATRARNFWRTSARASYCLAMACERGDDDAWRAFEAEYRHGMQAAARALTKDEGEAEELTQSLYGELYGCGWRGSGASASWPTTRGRPLGGWLRAVVYQAFIDRKRQSARFEQVEETEEFDRLAARGEGPLTSPAPRPDESRRAAAAGYRKGHRPGLRGGRGARPAALELRLLR